MMLYIIFMLKLCFCKYNIRSNNSNKNLTIGMNFKPATTTTPNTIIERNSVSTLSRSSFL